MEIERNRRPSSPATRSAAQIATSRGQSRCFAVSLSPTPVSRNKNTDEHMPVARSILPSSDSDSVHLQLAWTLDSQRGQPTTPTAPLRPPPSYTRVTITRATLTARPLSPPSSPKYSSTTSRRSTLAIYTIVTERR